MTQDWFGYLHNSGHYKLKRYTQTGYAQAKTSEDIQELYGPWLDVDRKTAELKLKDCIPKPEVPFLPVPMTEIERMEAQLSAGQKLFRKLTPPNIPEEFNSWNNKYNRKAQELFCRGGSLADWETVEGVDRRHAITHLKAILLSFEPSSEQKMQIAAYLISIWFVADTLNLGGR